GMIVDYRLRQQDGKYKAVKALQGIGFTVFAAGDSYNDLTMIKAADQGALFRAPQRIIEEEPQLPHTTDYEEFETIIDEFLAKG
ncbi:MAG: bifunctional phosphoserine phosphatase/homoserine phosphotransferase ThrH, partial [Sphaerochaetaceae bacterium]